MNRGTFIGRWILAALLVALGAVLCFALVGYSFLGLICFGIALLLGIYNLLSLLQAHDHSLAKVLRLVLTCVLVLGIAGAAVTGVVIFQAAEGAEKPGAQYLLVLGCGVNGTEPSRSLQDRIEAAYAYLVQYPNATCIVSGGKDGGENISEAQCMFNELTKMGIAPERIWLEDRATSTRENFDFSMTLIERETGQRPSRMAVVSSEYHLYRAGMFAREQNVTILGVPAKTSYPLLFTNYFLREIVMVWYYSTIGALA